MKKIALIGTVGIPAMYGGFETLAEYLTKYLANEFEFHVYCSAKSYKKKIEKYNNATLHYLPLNANGMQSVLYDSISIIHAFLKYDIIMVLGVSGAIIFPIIRLFLQNKKLFINIDGIEWKRAKWNNLSKIFLRFSEKIAVKNANIVITDNDGIREYIRNAYNSKDSILIPYGGDHVNREKFDDIDFLKWPFLNKPYHFSVCRIEPENNIHIILKAFEKLKLHNLAIVGNWSNSNYGEKLRRIYSVYNNIFLLDPIYEQKELNKIRSNCVLYLHGHKAGGTNPSLIEAMSLGLPVLAYEVIYNKYTTENMALYFSTSEELIEIIQKTDEYTLQKMGSDLRFIAEKRYQWKSIVNQYANIFKS